VMFFMGFALLPGRLDPAPVLFISIVRRGAVIIRSEDSC